MNAYLTFATSQDARDYRYQHGTGGWIFEPENDPSKLHYHPFTESILFPPEFTPSAIFNHPFAKGRNGRLIGN